MKNNIDGVKLPYELLPVKAIHEIVEVLEFGKNKYGANNWKLMYSKEDEQVFMGAVLRHIFAWQRGEKTDKQTGFDHLAHAACNLLFLQELKVIREEKENGKADKEKGEYKCGRHKVQTTD